MTPANRMMHLYSACIRYDSANVAELWESVSTRLVLVTVSIDRSLHLTVVSKERTEQCSQCSVPSLCTEQNNPSVKGQCTNNYFAHLPGEVLRSAYLSVCLSVRSRILTTTYPHFTKFSTRAWPTGGCGWVILWRYCNTYVVPVWWMTSCFHIMAPLGQNQRNVMFRRISQMAAPRLRLLSTIAGFIVTRYEYPLRGTCYGVMLVRPSVRPSHMHCVKMADQTQLFFLERRLTLRILNLTIRIVSPETLSKSRLLYRGAKMI